MATYTPAQLLTAAGKVDYRTLGGKYSNLTPAQLVAAAQKDSVLMSKITSYVPQQSPAEIKAAAAAKAAADAKAKAAADAANAKFQAEFAAKQAEQQKAAQAAADAAAAKVAADKAAAQQAAQAKATADAKAVADKAAAVKANQEAAAKAVADKAAAQQAAKEAAAKAVADKAAAAKAAEAKAAADAQALAESRAKAKADAEAKVAQTKLNDTWTEKIYAAKTPSEVADAAKQAKTAGAVVADATVTNALRNQYLNYSQSNRGAYTQSQLEDLQAQAKAAGVELPSALVTQIQKTVDMYTAAAPERAALTEQYKNWISNAGTPQEINRQIAMAKADGIAVDPAWAEKATATIKATELGKPFQDQLNQAKTQEDIDRVLSDAKAAGGTINPGVLDAATSRITQATQAAQARAQAEKTALAQAQYQQQAQQAQTPDEAKKIIDQAKAAGAWNLNDAVTNSYINAAQTRADQQQQTQSEFATAQKTVSGLQNLTLDSKIKLSDLDQSIQKDPDLLRLTDNGRIPLQMTDSKAPGYIGVNQLVNYVKSGDTYAQRRQAAYEYASKLAPPTQAQNIANEKGYFIGVPDDPTTEANEAGWYSLNSAADTVAKIGADAKPIGEIIGTKELQATTDQIRDNTQLYQAQQRDAARAAELAAQQFSVAEYEKTLPDPATLPAGAHRYGPGGANRNEYLLTPANRATGEPGHWIKMDKDMNYTDMKTGATFGQTGYNKQITTINDANSQVAAAERAARAAQQRADRDSTFFDTDFGKVFTVLALAAVVGPMIGEALSGGATVADAAGAAAGMAESGATAGEIASALEASGMSAEAAATMAETATGVASGAVDVQALGAANGITAEAVSAAANSANPLAAVNSTLVELNAAETAQLMSNIDPNMISSLAPTASGTAGGTAGSILSGTSLNPITNVLTNLGVTNPIISGALTGAGTGAVINAVTGKPITGDSLLMGALGGGVAGGIGSVMPDFGGGALGGAIGGAATNLGATAVVNLATGRPITLDNLASSALIGGAVGGAVGVLTDGAGNTTYQYDDGSSMTVSRTGTPVAVTDNTGATVPVGAVDRLTGEPKQLAPVEDRVGTPVAPKGPPAGTVAVQAPDGSVLYTDGQTYYTADGTVTDISNPTPGGATDTARLSEPNQQIITDATRDYGAGRIGWDEASARINQAVRNDIESGYLKNNGDGTYTAPDGVTYFMNRETGMYDAQVGVPGGTGSGPDTAPVTQVERPIAPPVINQLPVEPIAVAPPVDTIAQPVDTPRVPKETINQLPVAPTPEAPPAGPTAPVNVAPPVETPVVAPPVETPVETPVVAPPVSEPPVVTPTPGPVSPPTTTPGPGIIPINPPVVQPPAVVEPPPVVQPPVVEPPVAQPPAVTPVAPPVTEPPVVQPPAVAPPVVEPPAVVEPPPAVVQPPAVVEPPYVPPTYPPIYVPPVETPPATRPGYGPITPLDWGRGVPLDMSGLNPGYITNVPRQYESSGVRSQYYYGPKPYQTGGPTGQVFDPALYRSAPAAPVAPWGLQQMYNPQTQTIENLLRGVGVAAGQAPYNRPGAPKV